MPHPIPSHRYLELLETRRLLAGGDLDPSFGSAGQTISDFPVVPTDLAVQSDGKILVSGFGLGDVGTVIRFNADGSPDLTFGGGDGLANVEYGMYYSVGNAVAVGPTGRIAIVGTTQGYNTSSPIEATLVVYNAQGQLDTGFKRPIGSTTLGAGGGFSEVAFQADGKLLVLGRRLYRFNTDGSLDSTFGGGDGTVQEISGKEIVVQPDGKILILGHFALFRLKTDGTLDSSFDGDGVLPNVKGWDLALAADGDTYVAGNGNNAQLVSRFNSDGSIDKAFGASGHATVYGGTLLAVTEQNVFVGGTSTTPSAEMEVTALTLNGSRDARFSDDGYALLPVNANHRRTTLLGLAVQQGKLLALGGAELFVTPPEGATEIHPALLRVQVPGTATTGQSPFSGTPLLLPGVIQAENFDKGGETVAYHDTESANLGGIYRTGEGVDLQAITGGGTKVGFIRAGEWLEYTVSVAASGKYDLGFRVGHLKRGGTFHLEVDGQNVTGTLTVPQTGSWDAFTTVSKSGVTLAAGTHVLRLKFDSAGDLGFAGNLDWISVASQRRPFHGFPFQAGQNIQAEDFDEGGEGVTYHDTTAANEGGAYRQTGVDIQPIGAPAAFNVGWLKPGEWMEYTIDVAQAGSHDWTFRLASQGNSGTFLLLVDGQVRSQVSILDTSGWQSYQDRVVSTIHLDAGQHVVRLQMQSANQTGFTVNIDWFRFAHT